MWIRMIITTITIYLLVGRDYDFDQTWLPAGRTARISKLLSLCRLFAFFTHLASIWPLYNHHITIIIRSTLLKFHDSFARSTCHVLPLFCCKNHTLVISVPWCEASLSLLQNRLVKRVFVIKDECISSCLNLSVSFRISCSKLILDKITCSWASSQLRASLASPGCLSSCL